MGRPFWTAAAILLAETNRKGAGSGSSPTWSTIFVPGMVVYLGGKGFYTAFIPFRFLVLEDLCKYEQCSYLQRFSLNTQRSHLKLGVGRLESES